MEYSIFLDSEAVLKFHLHFSSHITLSYHYHIIIYHSLPYPIIIYDIISYPGLTFFALSNLTISRSIFSYIIFSSMFLPDSRRPYQFFRGRFCNFNERISGNSARDTNIRLSISWCMFCSIEGSFPIGWHQCEWVIESFE